MCVHVPFLFAFVFLCVHVCAYASCTSMYVYVCVLLLAFVRAVVSLRRLWVNKAMSDCLNG